MPKRPTHEETTANGPIDAEATIRFTATQAKPEPPSVAPAPAFRPDEQTSGTHRVFLPTRRRDTPATCVLGRPLHPDRATLTVLLGAEAGATFGLDGVESTLGRNRSSTLPIEESSVSRNHARIVREAEGRYRIDDLDSTNGTYVDGRRVKSAELRSGDRIQIGRACVFRFAMIDELEETMQRRLYEAATHDELTGLSNRRTLGERLAAEIARANATGEELAFLMIDVDHFKRVNDQLGHSGGDEVLRNVARCAAGAVRAEDTVARYGGEEIAVVVPGAGRERALQLAEDLRAKIESTPIEVGRAVVTMTVSVGVARLSECAPRRDALALISLADGRLYAAKRAGRNRVVATP